MIKKQSGHILKRIPMGNTTLKFKITLYAVLTVEYIAILVKISKFVGSIRIGAKTFETPCNS